MNYFMTGDLVVQFLAQGAQMTFVLLLAPLAVGVVRRVKARLMRRQGPPLLQAYFDLAKLLRKESVIAESASWLFRSAPYLIFALTWVAAALVPSFASGLMFNWAADVVALVALLGAARALLALAGMAELERLSHHINDVGAICNDASVLTIHARCTLQREDVLSVADACFGHRLMMDRVVPGGVAVDLSPEGVGRIRGLLTRFEETRAEILRVYDSLPSLQDRTVTTGIVSPELVRQYAAGGFVGRACGRAFDARKSFPYAPYDGVGFDIKTRTAGDVDARLLVRMVWQTRITTAEGKLVAVVTQTQMVL